MSEFTKQNLGDRLLNPTYTPENKETFNPVSDYRKNIKLPVKFTDDILEYAESKEFLGLTLFPKQRQFLGEFFAVDALGYPVYDTGILISGMRSGKSVLAGIAATFQAQRLLALEDPARDLRQMPGDRITIQVLASSEEQAKESIWAKIVAIIDSNKYWQKYIEYLKKREETEGRGRNSLFEQKQLSIEFHEKNIALMSLHSNSAALAGKTSAFAAFDELARMDSIEGSVQSRTQKRTADAVYYTVARSTKSLRGFAKTLVITSPLYESELSMRLLYMAGTLDIGSQAPVINALRTKYPERDPRAYGMHCTTLEFNPTLTEDDFISERTTNPEAYRRDYLAIPPAALSPFFEYPERVEKCVKEIEDPIMLFEDTILEDGINTEEGFISRMYVGKKVFPTKIDPFNKYYICCDQGEKKDSFVIAMGHLEEEDITFKNPHGAEISKIIYKVIIDIIEDWIPDKENRITVSFSNVEEVILKIAENYNIMKVTYDQWNAVESIQRLFSQGLYTEQLGINIDMYEEFKRLVYQGQVVLPRNDKLLTEIRQLNKLKGKYIDHPIGGSKDRSDAVCRVVYSIYMDYIKDAMEGGQMQGQGTAFPTIRSLDQAFDVVNNSFAQDTPTIWGSVGGGFSFDDNNVFGKGMVTRTNVVANIQQKK